MSEIERARNALFAIPPNLDREHWVRVGMAAKAAGLEFDDFHEWSQPAQNYGGERDCESVWKSFSESGPITEGTLFATAINNGWQDPSKRPQAANGRRTAEHIPAHRKAPVAPVKKPQGSSVSEVWERCTPASAEHEYIAAKGGLPTGLRIYPYDAPPLQIRNVDVRGWLAVPCSDLDGMLQTIQFISADGTKLNLAGATFGDGFFVVGDLLEPMQIYIAEGLGQAWAVHAVADAPAVVCFGASRMRTVAAAIRGRFPTAAIVLVPDKGKESQCADIARDLSCAWVQMPSDKPANFDVNDLALGDGPNEGPEALDALLKQAKTTSTRFQLLSATELATAPPLRWLVRGVLPAEGLAALYGPSGSGKSFLVLDLAAAIAGASGEWFGRRVNAAPVTFCVLEGEAGLSKRLAAWSRHHQKPNPDRLRFINEQVDLIADVTELGKAIQAAGGAGGLVIIDTLNRSAPGADENSSVDMGNLISAAKQLQTLVAGLVLLVHHTGKDATKGLRGHSSLYAALDGAIEVCKTDFRREWTVAKSKDDETGAVHSFRLDVIPLGTDVEGEPVTSCVVVPDDSQISIARVKLPQGGNQMIALNALAAPLRESLIFGKPGAIPSRPCLELEEAVRIVADSLAVEKKRRNERAREAIAGLVGRGIYGLHDGWIWRAD